jgi:hypothetical protein
VPCSRILVVQNLLFDLGSMNPIKSPRIGQILRSEWGISLKQLGFTRPQLPGPDQ